MSVVNGNERSEIEMVSGETKEEVILASGGYDHTIRFWSPLNGQCLRIVQHPDSQQVNCMEITPDKQLLAAAGYQHIRMYDIQSSKNPSPVINYEGVSKNVTSVGFNEEGRWMFSGGEDGSARIWDMKTKNSQAQKVLDIGSPVNSVALHPNQTDVFIGDQNGNVHIWDLRNDKSKHEAVEADVSIQHISVEPEGNYLAAVDNKGSCYVFAVNPNVANQNFQRRLKLNAHKRYALKCKFSPDSTLLVTTSADQTAKIWRTSDLLPLNNKDPKDPQDQWPVADNLSPYVELKDANQRWVWDVAFSNDSQYIITASSDNVARLWGINEGDIKREYTGHQKAVTALAFVDGQAYKRYNREYRKVVIIYECMECPITTRCENGWLRIARRDAVLD
ncbi:target of rapamycin complex subunit lst8-like isoform X1 [Leptotrombidium deliense]|uniref:Target of rapamycin complex subunit lst8 n=1 Tax=Leptotrombidium deliense TaxID=299467 RepID=A0A443SDZ3_9ACAR|nr:target of rapamycin complex subunit lst8-like isoform X1 [Leptotrombidium deliense]